MKKAFIVIAVWFLASSIANKNAAQTQNVPYETSVFSVQYPAGAQIEPRQEKDENSTSYDYDGLIPKRSSVAIISYTDLPTPAKGDLATTMLKSPPVAFKPGYHSDPIKNVTVGNLPGKEQTLYGETTDSPGKITVRWRMANSKNGLRAWILMTSSRGSNGLSEADSEKFFDSLKIK